MRSSPPSFAALALGAVLLGGGILAAQEAGRGAAAAQEATPVASAAAIVADLAMPRIAIGELLNPALGDAAIADDLGIPLGGTGSDLWQGPGDATDEFWMVTDRGPNVDVEVAGEDLLTFPLPGFTPTILHVRAGDGGVEILEAIPLMGSDGAPVGGLSNLPEHDPAPYGIGGAAALAFDPDGLDVEGLVRAADGGFWLAEEYAPSLVKVGADGVVEARFVPEGLGMAGASYPVEETLPAIYAERRANRGFEGLALSPDGATLYLLLQSPLANPDGVASETSRTGRILAVDAATGRPTAEYAYEFEDGPAFDPAEGVEQGDMKLSAVVAVDAGTLLVLERTDEVARVYAAELAGATDLLGSAWDDAATDPSLETAGDLAAAGVTPLAKTLLVDLEALAGMPDKIEGLAVVDAGLLAVANDNDFDLDFDEAGRWVSAGKEGRLLLIEAPGVPAIAADGSAAPTAASPTAGS